MGRRDRLAAENRVRNLALDTETFDGEYLLVIRMNGQPLVTLGQPSGPGGRPSKFILWEGLPEDDEQDEAEIITYVTEGYAVDDVWNAAIKVAYQEALTRAIKIKNALVAEGVAG